MYCNILRSASQFSGEETLAAVWLLRAVPRGSQRLPSILADTRKLLEKLWLPSIQRANFCRSALESALHTVTLGSATVLSLVSLWSGLRGKSFKVRKPHKSSHVYPSSEECCPKVWAALHHSEGTPFVNLLAGGWLRSSHFSFLQDMSSVSDFPEAQGLRCT